MWVFGGPARAVGTDDSDIDPLADFDA